MSIKEKNIDDLKKFYNNNYKKKIEKYYETISQEEKSIIVSRFVLLTILVIAFIIYTYFLSTKSTVSHNIIYIFLMFFIFILLVLVYSAKSSLNKLIYKMNELIIKDIICFISETTENNVSLEPKKMLSREAFEQMDLFNLNVVNYTGNNYVRVPYNKNTLVFSDMETYMIDIVKHQEEIYKNGRKYIRTTRKKEKRSIFKGLYIGATLNKNNSNHIYLIPNNFNDLFLQSKIMNYISFHGVEVVLENLEFSKKYKVLCDDEIDARYILSLSLMEKINNLDELFKEKKYIVFKEGKRFAICLEGVTIEKIKNVKMPYHIDDEKVFNGLVNIFNRINKLFQVYHVLDLGNDVYVTNQINSSANQKPVLPMKSVIPTNINNINSNHLVSSDNNNSNINFIAYKFDFDNNYSFLVNLNKKFGAVVKTSPVAYKVGNHFNIMIAKCNDETLLKQRANDWMKVSASKNQQQICDNLDKEYMLKNNLKIYEKVVIKDGKDRYYKFFFYNNAMIIVGYSNSSLNDTINYSVSTIRLLNNTK